MKTFLIVVAGVVSGFGLLGLIGWLWIRRKLGDVCQAIAQVAAAGALSPFRVHLEPTRALPWQDGEGLAAATNAFESMGYVPIGDYRLRELDDVRLRAFLHPDEAIHAVLYEHDQVGLYADVVRDFEDGTRVTVSGAPEIGTDRPPHAPLVRVPGDVREPGTVQTLHDRLLRESDGRLPIRVGAEDFAQVFSEAWAQEMDWRIARGGVTREEIEQIAALSGQPDPDDDQIALVQGIWANAIGEFIEEEVTSQWLADSGLSALDWERLRDRIVVVHDHGEPDDRIDELAWRLVEEAIDLASDATDDAEVDRTHDDALARIRTAFAGRSTRHGFSAAQALLPEKRRYEHLGHVEAPWPADVWAAPPDPDPT